jgi:hypothetical protein
MTPVVAGKKLSRFDPKTFLSTMDGGRKVAAFPKKQTIFAQGDSSDAVSHQGAVTVHVSTLSASSQEVGG